MIPLRFRCSGCGEVVSPTPASPFPFRCPNAPRAQGGDDVDHVLVRTRSAEVAWPTSGEDAPFLRYRTLSASYALAREQGMTDESYVALVRRLDDAVAKVDGHGFRLTPTRRESRLAAAIAPGAAALELHVKDETGNVSGSHKARHLMGILVYLEVARALGIAEDATSRLAIASCGNAALAAAVVAGAGPRPLDVFIPDDANPRVVERLAALGAHVAVCTRGAASPPGDPCYHAFRRAVDAGALPFCCQGGDDALTLDGGETLAYELAEAVPDLDAVFVQVGGGALASSLVQGLRVARDGGVLRKMPRIFTVQTVGAAPLERAHRRVVERLAAGGAGTSPSAAALDEALAYAASHRSAFMWPWEEAPRSVAHGILDDETYDWLAVVRGMLETGGRPLVVDEATIVRANQLARAYTDVPVDATGSAGLAGLLALHESEPTSVRGHVAVLFTGRDRDRP